MLALYYGLLWIGMLIGSISLTVLVVVLAVHLKKVFWQRIWPIFTVTLISLLLVCFVIAAGILFFTNIQPKWLSWYSLALLLVYLTSSIFILKHWLATRKIEEQKEIKSSHIKIAAASIFFIAFSLILVGYSNIKMIDKYAHVYGAITKDINSILPVRIPESQNAYPLYEQASKTLESKGKLPEWFDHSPANRAQVLPHIFSAEVSAFVAKNQDALIILNKALSMPDYWYEIKADKCFIESDMPRFMPYRQMARLLSYSAIAKSGTGNHAAALQDLAAIETISKHIKKYPILLSSMISIAIDWIRVSSLEYILATSSNLPSSAIKLPVKVHATSVEEIQNIFLFESLAGLQMFSKYGANINFYDNSYIMPDDTHFNDYLWKYILSPISSLAYSAFLYPLEIEAQLKTIPEISKQVTGYEELYHSTEKVNQIKASKGSILSIMSIISYDSYIDRMMSNDARKGLADLALAVTAYKAQKGRYPERIEELLPEYINRLPVDPYDNQPLKLKHIKGGLDLYSVGYNPKFDLKRKEDPKEIIHFYLGKDAYEEYRLKPEQEKFKQKKCS
jgi:membrane protein YdbS with pleckstrin-like domain